MKRAQRMPGLMLFWGVFFIFFIFMSATSPLISAEETQLNDNGVKALFLMSKNFGLNYLLMRDIIEQYGWNVTHTGLELVIPFCPWADNLFHLPALIADCLVTEINNPADYDCVILPPGPGNSNPIPNPFADLIASTDALNLLTSASNDSIPIYAMCAGVRVLAKANVIAGKKVVGSPRFKAEYKAAGAIYIENYPETNDHGTMIDGNIVTGLNGLDYGISNCQGIATAIENHQNKRGAKAASNTKFIFMKPVDFGDADVLWAKTYGGLAADGGRALCDTDDGGLLITGYSFSEGSGDADILVIRVDTEGNLTWSKVFGGAGTEYGYGCISVNGGFLITGYTTSYGAGSKDVYLLKIDADGNEIWSKTFGGRQWEVGTAVAETREGDYVVCGFTKLPEADEEDIYLIKTDSNGNEIWTKIYGESRLEMGNSICLNEDGSILIGGTRKENSDENCNAYLLKTDANGNERFHKSFNNVSTTHAYGFDWCNAMSPTRDGGSILVGHTDCNDILNAYAIKTDAQGNQIWSLSFGDSPFHQYGNSVTQTSDGGFIVFGTTKTILFGNKIYNNDFYLVKLDEQGKIIWTKSIGGTESEWGYRIYETKAGNLFALGYTSSFGMGSYDVCLLKISNLYARFSADPPSGHAPLTVKFFDQSLGNVLSWQWDFNADGTIDSREQNPTWTYEQPGTYHVALIISDHSRSDTLRYQNFIRVFDGESALAFDGEQSYVLCPTTPSLNITENLTVEAWINPSGWGENEMLGFGRIVDKEKFALYLVKSLPGFADSCLAFQFYNINNSKSISMTPTGSIHLNEWQQIVVTYAGPTGEVKMYINGVEQTLTQTRPPSDNIAGHENFDLYIGNQQKQDFTFDGVIDEVRLWNIVKSGNEIQANMDAHFMKGQPGLICCWGMNEGCGQFISDNSGNDHTGTIFNATWHQGKCLTPTSIQPPSAVYSPDYFSLDQNFPNPFNPATFIQFVLPKTSQITLKIYDITGREIKTLIESQKNAGIYTIKWDGTDGNDNKVSSGLYLYQLTAETETLTKKMLLLR